MAANSSPFGAAEKTHATKDDVEHGSDIDSLQRGDLLSLEHTDPVLNAKMHLVNNAIDEIGMTTYQWRLFVLNGFGYAVDSLILLIQSIIAGQAALEFQPSFSRGLTIAVYVGMLVGALFWGLSADIIGRRIAFNTSLVICSVFAIVAGSSPNWIVLGLFVCLSAFGAGGSLVLDTAVFLEFLPSKDQWLLTLMAAWWGLQACGVTGAWDRRGSVASAHAKKRFSLREVWVHLKGLFATKRMGLSTSLIWFSWLLIGLAYPLYNVFLPSYLATRGASFGQLSQSITWRNYAITNLCSIPGPILAGLMCKSRWFWGRRGTMVIGALVTMAFFFAYTQVRNNAQNLGFNCAISFCLNIYYGTLYAYTPEVLPSAHRGTGNGIAIGLNRVMGILSAVIATVSNTSTPVPIYTCAALYIVMAAVAAAFPFEPMGNRSS
ncbi:transporter [Cryomyces antarcticus]|uniref:Transporter n=1 Tax=Cryomyces antarcticus TaxID=329879 RepID=A0ABR0LNE9_9PEZI|nr:transporter [Cryomyces antarcticus]